eukprot:4880429-Amphidinium_carterae.1
MPRHLLLNLTNLQKQTGLVSSTTTVVTTSEDSEEHFYDCWPAVAQPAHTMPTQKKPKQKEAKQKATQKQVRFNADALTHYCCLPRVPTRFCQPFHRTM